jgi:hypothetical protein
MTAENLKIVSNENLVRDAKQLCAEERRLTTLVLEYLREIESRKIHLLMGYSSLYEFCKTELHYSEGSAHRRISAMRLMAEVPEIKPMIESGAVSLSGIASVHSFCNNQKKQEKPVPIEDKKKLVEDIQNKTTRQVESMLLTLDPQAAKKDRERLVTPELTEVKVTLDQPTMKMIDDLKSWLSHSMPFASTKDILVLALKELAERKNPSKPVGQRPKHPEIKQQQQLCTIARQPKQHKTQQQNGTQNLEHISQRLTLTRQTTANQRMRQRKQPQGVTAATNTATTLPISKKISSDRSRYIPPAIKRMVWNQHQGKCCYKDAGTGKVCGSQKFIQIDHKFPFSRGGGHDLSNLQLLCGAHNRMKSDQVGRNSC